MAKLKARNTRLFSWEKVTFKISTNVKYLFFINRRETLYPPPTKVRTLLACHNDFQFLGHNLTAAAVRFLNVENSNKYQRQCRP